MSHKQTGGKCKLEEIIGIGGITPNDTSTVDLIFHMLVCSVKKRKGMSRNHGVLSGTSWLENQTHVHVWLLVGLACFLQSGCYDWFPDRACCCSCVDPLSSQAAHIQVQVICLHGCDHGGSVFLQPYTVHYLLWTFAPFVTCKKVDFYNDTGLNCWANLLCVHGG